MITLILGDSMAKKLNKRGYELAQQMIKHGFEIEHDENNWSEVKPSVQETTEYLDTHDLEEYGAWFLGIDTEAKENSQAKFVYPFGDFKVVHKSALLETETKARTNNDNEIAEAAKRLLQMIK